MTLANDEQPDKTAAPTGGTEARRRPITDVDRWLNNLDEIERCTLRSLGELLLGAVNREETETFFEFTTSRLGVVDFGRIIDESIPLNGVSQLTTAVALAELIDEHAGSCQLGPGDYNAAPKWTQTDLGGQRYRHPALMSVHFPAGTVLDEAACVIKIDARGRIESELCVYVTPEHQDGARMVRDRLIERADALNPYRGRAVRATYAQQLYFDAIDLPATATRDNVVVPDEVWTEIDLGVAAVRDHHELLNTHGLGARRGVLLCGPPGTGKSAVSAVVARELVGEFTVIYVEARAGAALLTAVVEEAQQLGGSALLVLEDVDLWCRDRAAGDSGLSELLQAMDIRPAARILTLASTNDAETLDDAAIRTGRFDAIVEVSYPDRADATRILQALVRGLPGGDTVDAAAVAAALPEKTSGSDIREIVRRGLLTGAGGHVSTAALLAEVGAGRYRVVVPGGMYL